jgi:hypothetical protein
MTRLVSYALILICSASPAFAPNEYEHASEFEQAYWHSVEPYAKGYWDKLQ